MKTIPLSPARPAFKLNVLSILIALSPFLLIYIGFELQELLPSMGLLDTGIWQLLLLSVLSFLGLTRLSWWLLRHTLQHLGFPPVNLLVSQFKNLTLWQQFVFYWASFGLLLLAAMLSLIAVF